MRISPRLEFLFRRRLLLGLIVVACVAELTGRDILSPIDLPPGAASAAQPLLLRSNFRSYIFDGGFRFRGGGRTIGNDSTRELVRYDASGFRVGQVLSAGELRNGRCTNPPWFLILTPRKGYKRAVRLGLDNMCQLIVRDVQEGRITQEDISVAKMGHAAHKFDLSSKATPLFLQQQGGSGYIYGYGRLYGAGIILGELSAYLAYNYDGSWFVDGTTQAGVNYGSASCLTDPDTSFLGPSDYIDTETYCDFFDYGEIDWFAYAYYSGAGGCGGFAWPNWQYSGIEG